MELEAVPHQPRHRSVWRPPVLPQAVGLGRCRIQASGAVCCDGEARTRLNRFAPRWLSRPTLVRAVTRWVRAVVRIKHFRSTDSMSAA